MASFCPTCGTYLAAGAACPQHGNPANRRRDRARRDGRTATAWQRIRRAVIARDQACTTCGTTTRLTVHRIGGGYHDANLAAYTTLCASCHGRTDANARKGGPAFGHTPPRERPGGFPRTDSQLVRGPS